MRENREVFFIFQKMTTQWNVGFAGRTGLKYENLKFVADMYSIELDTNTFEKIQIMESFMIEHDTKQNNTPKRGS